MAHGFRHYYATQSRVSLLILFVVLNIYMFLEIRNDRFWLSDFSVYHKAAGRLVAGENLYQGESDGFYRYKYSPTAALYFIPLGILPIYVAKVLYWIFLSVVVCLGFYLSSRLAQPDTEIASPAGRNNIILISALVMGVNIERELHLGQVNQILLVSYLAFACFIRARRQVLASLVLATSIFLKPFGLIFLPYLLIRRKFRAVIYFSIFLIVLGILPALFVGSGKLPGQLSGWSRELLVELSGKQELLHGGNHTVFSVLARYTPMRFLVTATGEAVAFQALVLLILAAFFAFIVVKGKDLPNRLVLESAVLMALIPLLAFTSYNAFGFLELAAVLTLFSLPRMTRLQIGIAIAGLFLVGFNMHDIVGHRLWILFNDLSLVSVGSMILLAVLFSMRMKGQA